MEEEDSEKGLGLKVEFTPAATEEIKELKKISGADNKEIVRYCLCMGKLIISEQQKGNSVIIIPNSSINKKIYGKFQQIKNYKVILGEFY